MMTSNRFGQYILIAAGALLLQSTPAFAVEEMPMKAGRMATQSPQCDWLQHTQRTIDDLKIKLNLTPEQMAAWNTWSGGVLADARQQLENKKPMHEDKHHGMKSMVDQTTPEQMAEGIARLRAEMSWMQEHLARLEAAQVRTLAFYNVLGVNQKTIFDLFWREMHHKVSGPDDGRRMHEHERSDGCSMMEQR